MSMQKVITVADAKLMSNVKNTFILCAFLVVKHVIFCNNRLSILNTNKNSSAKLLRQTAKTCQCEEKNEKKVQKN